MGDKVTISLQILLTGFVVVFLVLLLLIFVIKIYGTIVYNAQNKPKKDKKKAKTDVEAQATVVPAPPVVTKQGGVSTEIVAAIAAAVDYIYGPNKVVVKNIKKSQTPKRAWFNAGVMNNTRPF